MSGLVDKTGNELNTKAEEKKVEEPKPDEKETGLPNGDDGPETQQQAERTTDLRIEEGYIVLRIPINNNLYVTLSSLAWAEDKIRGIYVAAQQEKAKKSGLISPVGRMMKSFKNRWS